MGTLVPKRVKHISLPLSTYQRKTGGLHFWQRQSVCEEWRLGTFPGYRCWGGERAPWAKLAKPPQVWPIYPLCGKQEVLQTGRYQNCSVCRTHPSADELVFLEKNYVSMSIKPLSNVQKLRHEIFWVISSLFKIKYCSWLYSDSRKGSCARTGTMGRVLIYW